MELFAGRGNLDKQGLRQEEETLTSKSGIELVGSVELGKSGRLLSRRGVTFQSLLFDANYFNGFRLPFSQGRFHRRYGLEFFPAGLFLGAKNRGQQPKSSFTPPLTTDDEELRKYIRHESCRDLELPFWVFPKAADMVHRRLWRASVPIYQEGEVGREAS